MYFWSMPTPSREVSTALCSKLAGAPAVLAVTICAWKIKAPGAMPIGLKWPRMAFSARISRRAGLQQFGDQSAPAGLMRCAHTATVVTVKVFVEEHVIFEVRVGRELRVIFQNRPLPVPSF